MPADDAGNPRAGFVRVTHSQRITYEAEVAGERSTPVANPRVAASRLQTVRYTLGTRTASNFACEPEADQN